MSAIGSYAVLSRSEWATCAALALNVLTETTGRWIFKGSRVVGVEEFEQSWQAALVREVDFEFSGYALGSYLDAQQAINDIALVNERSALARALARVFTAGFPFEAPVSLPALVEDRLRAFCAEEWGEEAEGMVAAIVAADAFYRRGLSELSEDHVVVFVIR